MSAIAAIPTRYAGVQFRSRLEARWAAFFDLIGWTWQYEPLDLLGYISDFIVGAGNAARLIEVKPAMKLSEYEPAQLKIEQSGWTGHASCVGAMICTLDYEPRAACLGSEAPFSVRGEWWWSPWFVYDFPQSELVAKWREAGNRAQWNPPKEIGAALLAELDQSPLGIVQREMKRASERGERDRVRLLAQLTIAMRRNDAADVATLRASLGMEATA